MDFQFSTFDTRRYGYIRGISILNNLVLGRGGEKKDLVLGDWAVNDIAIVSGHIAVRYQHSKAVVLFDATPAKMHMGEAATQSIEAVLFAKQYLPGASAAPQLPMLACSFNTQIVKMGFEKYMVSAAAKQGPSLQKMGSASGLTVTDVNPLRFYVFEEDGTLHLWDWSTVDYKWRYSVRVYLPFQRIHMVMPPTVDPFHPGQPITMQPATLRVKVCAAFASSQGIHVTWLVDGVIYIRVFNFDLYSRKKDQLHNQQIPVKDATTLRFLEEMFPLNLNISAPETFEMKKEWIEYINQDTTRIMSTKIGIWFVTKSFILHWSQKFKTWNITYYKDISALSTAMQQLTMSNRHCDLHGISTETEEDSATTSKEESSKANRPIEGVIYSVLCFCRNPASQELMVLEPSGRLFSLEPSVEKDKLKLHLVAVINTPSDYMDSGAQSSIRMMMHQNALVVVNEHHSYFYDLKCGKLLSKVALPIDFKPYASTRVQGTWENGTAGIVWGCGIWSRNEGLWEIRAVSPTHLIQSLSAHPVQNATVTGDSATIGCAPLACRQLDMKQLEAKYLLDMALAEKNEELKIHICKALLPRLENPALVIAILSNLQSESSSKFILEELTGFLEQYDYYQEAIHHNTLSTIVRGGNPLKQTTNGTSTAFSAVASEDEKIQTSKIKNSFLFHTPFNHKMIPLLKEYYTLQKEALDEDISQGQGPLNTDEDFSLLLAGIPDEHVLYLNPNFVEILIRKNPSLLLQKLENALSLNEIDYSKYSEFSTPEIIPQVNPLLLHPEENLHVKPTPQQNVHLTVEESLKKFKNEQQQQQQQQQQQPPQQANFTDSPPYPLFEILCQLYYQEKPADLVPFVRIIHNASMIKAIEYSLSNNNQPNGSIIFEITEKDHFMRCLLAIPVQLPSPSEEERIDARVKLLCAIGHKPNALRFLLNCSQWEKAMEMVKLTPYHDKVIFVLYEIILTYCVEKKDSGKLKQCWDILPKNFSVFNLLSLLKPNNGNSALPQGAGVNVDTMRNSFKKGTTTPSKANSPYSFNGFNLNNPNHHPITNVIYNPQILSTNPSEDLTVEMFRGQLLKMLATINK